MQRHMGTQASSIVIFISILTILVQYLTYYFFDPIIIIWAVSCLVSAICCHVLLEQTAAYRICFDYSFLTLFISLIIIILTYYGNVRTFLPYTDTMLGIAFINWLIPMLYCIIRNMLDFSPKADDFCSFYRYGSIVFLFFYTGILIYGCFARDAFPWAYGTSIQTSAYFPFDVLSSQIQNYLDGIIPLKDILIYLASRILIYIPYGYVIRLTLRRQKRLIRFSSLAVLPVLIEILQYFIIRERYNIDDLIYAVIGGFLGCFAFFLTNAAFRAFSGRDFLSKGSEYRGSGYPLHF